MTNRWMVLGAGAALAAGLWTVARPAGPMLATSDRLVADHATAIDYREIARKLVQQSARVREGEFILINGGSRDLELLEDLAIESRRLGAWPLVTMASDRMTRLMYDDVPATFDTQRPELAVRMVGLFPVNINVDFSEDDGVLDGVPPERIAARGLASQPVGDLAREFNVRTINLGNGFYPTNQRAAMFDLTLDQLQQIFWAGVNVDYGELQKTGLAVKAVLDAGKSMRITNPNGTDLTVQLGGTDALISDGVVSAEDERIGGAATTVWLPAGEVFTVPLIGSAEGTVVADHFFYQGHTIEGLTLEFSEGRLTSMTAEQGIEVVQAFYDVAGEGRDVFSVVDIGLNPAMTAVPGSRLMGWVSGGMVTIGVGNNAWAGGGNNVNFSIYPFLPGSTVMVDGTTLVEDGVLRTEMLLGVK